LHFCFPFSAVVGSNHPLPRHWSVRRRRSGQGTTATRRHEPPLWTTHR
jgi:hypothetical protein